MADFGGLRFACSEGGNDLRDGLRGAKKISEIFPNKSDQNGKINLFNFNILFNSQFSNGQFSRKFTKIVTKRPKLATTFGKS
jgi:hypothetical protein